MKYQDFKKAINKPYFNWQDIKLNKLEVFNYQLPLWRKRGYIEKIKRGLYVFSDEKESITPERISFLLYEPSYISLEYALGHYGFIPEIVCAITAATPRTTRKFSNVFGNFTYRHIKPNLFFGYVPADIGAGKYLMAEPEKAVLDYFYLNLDKISGQNDIGELRINYAEMKKTIDKNKITDYLKEYKIIKLENLIKLLLKNADH